jgi:Mn-dependent DtxR family transcriptional regulator
MRHGSDRNFESERRERMSRVILEHVHGLKEEPPAVLLINRIAMNLALEPREVAQILNDLAESGYIEWEALKKPIRLTAAGHDQVERLRSRGAGHGGRPRWGWSH